MKTVTVVPGLVVDEELFGLAAEGLAQHAPGLVIPTWEWFTSQESWLLVPDPQCFGYKAELLVHRAPLRTVKINLWMGPDLRAGEAARPHNHPWEFTAHVLRAGYREVRYGKTAAGAVAEECEHQAGGANHIALATFHEVVEIADPGRTLTLMDCGEGVQGDWGYMNPHTGKFEVNPPDPDFLARRAQLNPRLR